MLVATEAMSLKSVGMAASAKIKPAKKTAITLKEKVEEKNE